MPLGICILELYYHNQGKDQYIGIASNQALLICVGGKRAWYTLSAHVLKIHVGRRVWSSKRTWRLLASAILT